MAGDKVEILPSVVRLTLGVQDVLLLRNSDDVPQMFGPALIMPGQDFRLPFEQASENQFACTAHASGQMTVSVVAFPDPGWDRLKWRLAALSHAVRYLKNSHPNRPHVEKLKQVLPPAALIAAVLALWWVIVVQSASVIFPTPLQVVTGTLELVDDGTLVEAHRHLAVPGRLRLPAGGAGGGAAGPVDGPGRRRVPHLQPDLPDPAADLADRLDPAGDPVVRRRQRVADLPDLHRRRCSR